MALLLTRQAHSIMQQPTTTSCSEKHGWSFQSDFLLLDAFTILPISCRHDSYQGAITITGKMVAKRVQPILETKSSLASLDSLTERLPLPMPRLKLKTTLIFIPVVHLPKLTCWIDSVMAVELMLDLLRTLELRGRGEIKTIFSGALERSMVLRILLS